MNKLSGVVRLLLVLAAIAWVAWEILRALASEFGAIVRAGRGLHSSYRRKQWRREHPMAFDATRFSRALVDRWSAAACFAASGLDRSYDLDAEEAAPSDAERLAARDLRALAEWLRTKAESVERALLLDDGWRHSAPRWIALARDAQWNDEHAARVFAGSPERYWRFVDDAAALGALAGWLEARAGARTSSLDPVTARWWETVWEPPPLRPMPRLLREAAR